MNIRLLFIQLFMVLFCTSCVEVGMLNNGSSGISISSGGNASYMGRTILNGAQYKNLTVKGRFKAENIEVDEKAKIIGKTNIYDSKFKNITIIGKALIENLEVSEQLKIVGRADLDGGVYNNIILYGDNFEFVNLVANSIIAKPSINGKSKKEIILDLQNCKINGDIIFENGNGALYQDDKSTILGSVKGAKVS